MEIKLGALKNGEQIANPSGIADMMYRILLAEDKIDQDKEHFWVIGLDCGHVIKYIELVSLGILDKTVVHPREVFRLGVMKGIYSLILCHNHPSGTTAPSDADKKITETLVKAGEILDIKVLDHIIIGSDSSNGYCSLKELEIV